MESIEQSFTTLAKYSPTITITATNIVVALTFSEPHPNLAAIYSATIREGKTIEKQLRTLLGRIAAAAEGKFTRSVEVHLGNLQHYLDTADVGVLYTKIKTVVSNESIVRVDLTVAQENKEKLDAMNAACAYIEVVY
jgi:hypothetical protein